MTGPGCLCGSTFSLTPCGSSGSASRSIVCAVASSTAVPVYSCACQTGGRGEGLALRRPSDVEGGLESYLLLITYTVKVSV